MSSKRDLAFQAVSFCLWGIGVSTGSSAITKIEKAFSKTKDLAKALSGAPKDPAVQAAQHLMEMLEDTLEFSDDSVALAAELLAEKEGAIRGETDLLKKTEARQDFPKALYDHIFTTAPPPQEGRVDDILRAVIAEAFKELRKDDTFNKLFIQEGLASVEAEIGAISAQQRQLLDAVELHVAEKTELATLRSERKLLIAVVEAYTPEATQLDFQSSLANITSALASAARRLDLSDTSTNQGDAVDAIVAEVRRLNRQGDTTGAMAKLREDAARRRKERERQNAADIRILDEAIAQAELVNDADAFAEFTLEKIQLGTPSAEDKFKQLCSVFIDRYQAGQRTAAPFVLASATSLMRQGITIAPTPYLWAMAQNDMAATLQHQGFLTEGAKGSAMLAEAIVAFDAALTVYTREDHPANWAMAQNNKGIALQEEGRRADGTQGAALLAQAVVAYDAALEVWSKEEHPTHWATTQTNKSIALQQQGIRTDGAPGAALLERAVAACDAALEVRTRKDHPEEWAAAQNNRGAALQEQGIRTEGPPGAALLAAAVSAFDGALEVYVREEHPVHWAGTQSNKGMALTYQGARTRGQEGAELLARAVAACDAALEVRTREDHLMRWASTQENLAIAKEGWAEHESADDPRQLLTEALSHVEAGLTVYDAEHMSYSHAQNTRLRDRLRAKLDALS